MTKKSVGRLKRDEMKKTAEDLEKNFKEFENNNSWKNIKQIHNNIIAGLRQSILIERDFQNKEMISLLSTSELNELTANFKLLSTDIMNISNQLKSLSTQYEGKGDHASTDDVMLAFNIYEAYTAITTQIDVVVIEQMKVCIGLIEKARSLYNQKLQDEANNIENAVIVGEHS